MPLFTAPETWDSETEYDSEPTTPVRPLSRVQPPVCTVDARLETLFSDMNVKETFEVLTQVPDVGGFSSKWTLPVAFLRGLQRLGAGEAHLTQRALAAAHSQHATLQTQRQKQQERYESASKAYCATIRSNFGSMAALAEEIAEAEAARSKALAAEKKAKEEEAAKVKAEAAKRAKAEADKRAKEEEERAKAAEQQRIKAAAEAQAHAEAEAEAAKERELAAAAEKKEQEARAAAKASRKGKGVATAADIEREFLGYKQAIADIKATVVEPLLANKDLKSACFKLRRQINPKFGQLNNTESQLNAITQVVITAVNQAKEANTLALKWILNFIAKAIVVQAGTEVVTAPERALPLSRLALNLTAQFPELRYYLMARFVKKCPLVVGYTGAIDTEEGRLRMAWKRSAAGKWEDETRYNERIGGIFTVFSVLTRLRFESLHPQGVFPYPLSMAWTMMARLVNCPKELLGNVHFLAASNWWDAAAAQFLEAYGKQAEKLLFLMCNAWITSVQEREFAGAARLRIAGEAWMRAGVIEGFKPMER